MRALLAATCLLALLPAASGHGTFEAQELELHLLNDEGSDVINEYGGYDLNEVFVGAAHHPELGAGAAGDGVYFRIEAYGHPQPATAAQPWSITLRFTGAQGPVTRTITTADGETFSSDFDALEVLVEGVELHVERAFLLGSKVGLLPGTPLKDLVAESRVGTDLRDRAPGGIPVPGTNGLFDYPDPTQIDGRGRLLESPPVPGPDVYFGTVGAAIEGGVYRVTAASALKDGGQHFSLRPPGQQDWDYGLVAGGGEVEKGGSMEFRFTAAPRAGAAPLELDLLSDVGGRVPLRVLPDGTLEVRGATAATPPPPAPKESPGAGPLLALGLAAAAALRRRAVA